MSRSRWSIHVVVLCGVMSLFAAVVARGQRAPVDRLEVRGSSPATSHEHARGDILPTSQAERHGTNGRAAPATAPTSGAPASCDALARIRSFVERHPDEVFLGTSPMPDAVYEEMPDDEALAVATDWLAWLDLLDIQTTIGRRRFVVRRLITACHMGADAPRTPGVESIFLARIGRLLRLDQDGETRALLLSAVGAYAIKEPEPTLLQAVRERLADPNECVRARLRAIDVLQEPACSGDMRSFEAIAAVLDGPRDDLQIQAIPEISYLVKGEGIPMTDRERLRESLFLALDAIPDSDYDDWAAACFSDNLLDDPPSLVRALTAKSLTLRSAAAYALGKREAGADPDVARRLVDAARGSGPASYRRSAVEALWKLAEGHGPEASLALASIRSIALAGEDEEVRAHASFVLQALESAGRSDGGPAREHESDRTR